MQRLPACVWGITDALVLALDERLGEPVDAYVNGAQTWLRDDGPNGETIEWRLHPVAGYQRPPKVGTYEVFGAVALALGTGATPPASPASLWDGLEAFPAYEDQADIEPAVLASTCAEVLGVPPDISGMVEHDPVAAAWEAAGGKVSIVTMLLDQLRTR